MNTHAHTHPPWHLAETIDEENHSTKTSARPSKMARDLNDDLQKVIS